MIIDNNYIIRVSDKANSSVNFACEILKDYLFKIANLNLQIHTDTKRSDKEIIIGSLCDDIVGEEKETLKNDGYIIKTTKNKLQITSNSKRGVLYGVYGFLIDYLGCKFVAKNCFYIPKLQKIIIGDIDYNYSPPFEYRDFSDESCHSQEFALANKMNGQYYHLEEKDGGKYEFGGGFCHSIPILFSREEYFETHPEYFALVDGKRKSWPSQLCFSNTEIYDIAVQKILKLKRERPDLSIFTLSQADGYFYCECDECKKIYEREGSISGGLFQFINYVARECRKEYPDIIIDTIAYLHNKIPPKMQIEDNVQVRFCSIENCNIHALGECDFWSKRHYDKSSPENYLEQYKLWAKKVKRLFVWDYPVNICHSFMPVPNIRSVVKNIKLHYKMGVKGIFMNGAYIQEHSSLSELRGYVSSNLMWNPNADSEKLIKDFFNIYYQSAGKKMLEYYNLLEDRVKIVGLCAVAPSNLDENFYSKDFIEELDNILFLAEQLADNDEVLKRVQIEHLCIPNMQLILKPSTDKDFDDKLEKYFNKAHSLGITVFKEIEPSVSEKLYRYILRSKDWYFDKYEEFVSDNKD